MSHKRFFHSVCSMAVILLLSSATLPAHAAALPIPAVASSVVKGITRYFGKAGTREASEYLTQKGTRELVERVTASATREGGEEAVEQVARLTSKHGPEALAALDNTPAILPVIRSLDELPEAQAKAALARLSAGAMGRELAEATVKYGSVALRSELKHPGVGMIFVRSLGDEGAELASRLTPDQAVAIGRHADDIAKLPAAQRQGVLSMLRNDTEKMVAFVGRFVEANPGKTLFTAATTAVILAEPERILGTDEIVFDAEGNPVVVRKGGLADRAVQAGGEFAGHVSLNYLRPIYFAAVTIAATLLAGWLILKAWQLRKLRSLARRATSGGPKVSSH